MAGRHIEPPFCAAGYALRCFTVGMLGSAHCPRSGFPCGLYETAVGTRDWRSAVCADRIDRAESSVADGRRGFPAASHPDWHGSQSRTVAEPNSRGLSDALDRKDLLQPLYLAATVPRDHSGS